MYVDVDECSEDWRGESCDHTCRNTNGSYICGCYHGYKLMENNRSCEGLWFFTTVEDLWIYVCESM